jgi:hypothetical protein
MCFVCLHRAHASLFGLSPGEKSNVCTLSSNISIPSGYLYGAPNMKQSDDGRFRCLHTCKSCEDASGNVAFLSRKQNVISHICSSHIWCNPNCKMFGVSQSDFSRKHQVEKGGIFEYDYSTHTVSSKRKRSTQGHVEDRTTNKRQAIAVAATPETITMSESIAIDAMSAITPLRNQDVKFHLNSIVSDFKDQSNKLQSLRCELATKVRDQKLLELKLEEKNEDFEILKAQSNLQSQELQTASMAKDKELAQLKTSLEETNQQSQRLKSDLHMLQSKLEDQDKDLQQLKTKLEDQTKENKAQDREIYQLNEKLEEKTKAHDVLVLQLREQKEHNTHDNKDANVSIEFQVEKIIQKRTVKYDGKGEEKIEYLVKWNNSWEPISNLSNSKKLIQQFEKTNK